jgi:predicted AAA+ superfamily ATPase
MWLNRSKQKQALKAKILNLSRQVLMVQGARQVGKTSLIREVLGELKDHPVIEVNLLYSTSFTASGKTLFGRDFFGAAPQGEELIANIERQVGSLAKRDRQVLLFVDEVDRHPRVMEAVQTLAQFSDGLKCIFTGSALENLSTENAATGRKAYFDLYPLSFLEYVSAKNDRALEGFLQEADVSIAGADSSLHQATEFMHVQALAAFEEYLRLGGMPRLVASYLSGEGNAETLRYEVRDLVLSIEENVKLILGDKAKLYEYEDVLRRLVKLSLNTLRFTHLQVSHAGRSDAKRLVSKTVAARVAHKVRLWGDEGDLSKYLLFDCGVANYLLAGSDLMNAKIQEGDRAILLETVVGNSLVNQLGVREDLLYWKSGNKAEIEFAFRAPFFGGVDVKSSSTTSRSLQSMALSEPDLDLAIVVTKGKLAFHADFEARLPSAREVRKIKLLKLPYYLVDRCLDLGQRALG